MEGSLKIKDELVASIEGIQKGLVLNNQQYICPYRKVWTL